MVVAVSLCWPEINTTIAVETLNKCVFFFFLNTPPCCQAYFVNIELIRKFMGLVAIFFLSRLFIVLNIPGRNRVLKTKGYLQLVGLTYVKCGS